MFSKVDHHVSEYLCRWNIPGWDNLKHCFVDEIFVDHFLCSWDASGVKKSYCIWFPDSSVRKQPDKLTSRWTKLLNRASKMGSKVVLLGDLETCGSVTETSCVHFRLTSRNAIMMSGQCSMSGDQVRIFEYCCGGFKGWTRAMDILTKHENLNLQSVGGVDSDSTCVDMCTKHEHDRGHGTPLSELMSFDEFEDPKWFLGDLNLMRTWETISIRLIDFACISAPCQSFTTTGNNQGWEHALGVVLAKSITCAAIMETETIVLENSAQMYRNSTYYDFLMNFLRYWGYVLVAIDVVQIEHLHPATRNRCIAVAVRNPQTYDQPDFPRRPLKLNGFIPKHIGGVMRDRLGFGDVPDQLMQHLDLDSKDLEIFGLPELMPIAMRNKCRNPSILNRVVDVDCNKLSSGTAMAKYGDQQNLPFSSLEKFGILGELFGPANQIRFIAPIEILLCLGCSERTVIPRNNLLSWRIVGNAIHEYHALVGLITAWNFKLYEKSRPQLPLKTLLLRHQSRCWVANQLRVEEDAQVPGLLYVTYNENLKPGFEKQAHPNSIEAMIEVQNDPKRRKLEPQPEPKLSIDDGKPHDRCEQMRLTDEESDFCRRFEQKPFIIELWKARKRSCAQPKRINPSVKLDQACQKTNLAWTADLLDLQYDLLSKVTLEEDEMDIPCSQTLEETYMTAVQVHDSSQSTSDIEVFRVTPEQDVEDWILAKVSLEGSQIQFNAPRINGQVVVLSEKLHQLGDILQIDMTCSPRTVSTLQCVVIFLEEGVEMAKATVPFGTRLFEVFGTHHWNGQYYSEDGWIIPADRPIFQDQNVYLDDPLRYHKIMDEEPIEISADPISPTEPFEPEEPESTIQLEFAKVQKRLQPLFEHGGIGDDEMMLYLGLFTAQRRPQHVVLPYMMIDDIIPIEDHFVLPVLHENHWSLVATDTDFNGRKIFQIITDRHDVFQMIEEQIKIFETSAKYCKHWNFSMLMEPNWCGYEALSTLGTLWKITPSLLKPVDTTKTENILRLFGFLQGVDGSLLHCTDPDIDHLAWNLRHAFIQDIYDTPTVPQAFGFGWDESSPLYATLKTALTLRGLEKTKAGDLAMSILSTGDSRIPKLKQMKQHRMLQTASQIAAIHNIEFPTLNHGQAVTRLQRFFREKRARQMYQKKIDVTWLRSCSFPQKQFQVKNGHWLDVQPNIQTLTEGISIASLDELQPVLDAEVVLGPGAHAALTMDEVPNLCSPFSQTHEIVEIVDAMGYHALVKVWMVQLGSKPVVRTDMKNAQVVTDATSTIILKVFKSLVDVQTWNDVKTSPVKTIVKILWNDQKMNIVDVWSRKFFMMKNPKTPVEMDHSDVFSVFFRIDQSAVLKWLMKSGATAQPIFISELERKPVRVIWLGKELRHAHMGLNQIVESGTPHLGVVTSPGLDSFGLRFTETDFPTAWNKLKGDQIDPPKHIAEFGRYWIENLPVEFGHKHIVEWAEKVGWSMKPMKRIKQRWLVSAEEEPKEHLSANKVPVLVYPVAKSTKSPDRIMAGRIYTPKPPAATLRKQSNLPSKPEPLSTNNTNDVQDVWQTYRDRNGLPDNRILKTPYSAGKADSVSSGSRSSMSTTYDEEARARLTKCEDQIKLLTTKVGTVEKEVTGIRSSFSTLLDTKLEATSKRMMSDFKDMMVSMVAQVPQQGNQPGRTSNKDRDRVGRSRSPKAD